MRSKYGKLRLMRLFWIAVFFIAAFFIFRFFSTQRPSFFFPKWKDYAVHGVDLSKYQGQVDWYQLKNHEVKFAFIKATEGKELVDREFQSNWIGAKNAGVIRGAYHFYRPNLDWKIQARNFISQVEIEKGDLPPVLDIELVHHKDQLNLLSDIRKWLEVVEKHYGVRPIVYTYENYYNRFLLSEFKHYNLWIAKYSNSSPQLDDNARWEFWQFSETGELKGIDHKVDLNCFYGSEAQLKKILKK
jgi:lysozyme